MSKIWSVVFLFFIGVSLYAEEPQDNMLYVEYRIEPSEEWAKAAPRKLWVARPLYMRTDEPPDSAGGLHLSILVSEPDCWMINWFEKKAMHVVDQGPTFNVVPIIFGGTPAEQSAKLEFGRELAFFKEHNATELADTLVDGASYARLTTIIDSLPVVLYYDKSTSHPKMLTMAREDTLVVVTYEKYVPGLPVDTALFRPPADVTIVEAK